MTTPYMTGDICHDEGGFVRKAYPDPDSPLGKALRLPLAKRPAGWAALSGAPWTAGFGETGPQIGPDTVLTLDQAKAFIAARVQQIQHQLDLAIPWWRTLADARQDVFVNMAYNLGVAGFLEWKLFLGACRAEEWARAEVDMIGTPGKPDKWERQVKTRGTRLGKQILTGLRIDPASFKP